MKLSDLQQKIGAMTLDEKIGQMFMGNICGGESLDFAKKNFERYHFGALQFSGVFERFVRGGDYLPCSVCCNAPLDEVAAFLAEIKKAALDIVGIPAILAGDQEGSISNSIFRRRQVALMPSQMGFGALGMIEEAFASASVTAKEIKTLGLDMLYGPCLDVLTSVQNPEIGARSFSECPEVVAAMGEQVIKAYARNQLISNVKHFPGRGYGLGDAHKSLESIGLSRQDLDAKSLLPFRRAIAVGVDSFMIAHTLYPALESERLPASLSPRIVQGLLREEMGFDGLVIPDDLTMFAISQNFGIPKAAAMCLEAGADMIFMKVPEQYEPSIEAVKQSLREGRLTEERLHRSLTRILTLKLNKGLFEPSSFSREQVLRVVGCADHIAVARRVARNAVVLLKNHKRLLPLSGGGSLPLLAVVPRDMNVVLSNDKELSHDMLPRALRRYFTDVETMVMDEAPTTPQAYEAVGRAKNAQAIVFGIYSAGISESQLNVLKEIVALNKPVIAVITNSPYAAVRLPEQTAVIICSFGLTPFAFDAVAELIAGRMTPSATLPVTLNDTWKRGFNAACVKR